MLSRAPRNMHTTTTPKPDSSPATTATEMPLHFPGARGRFMIHERSTPVPRSYFGLSTEYWALPLYAEHMALFERVLSLLQVRGVIADARFRRRELERFIGGERKKIVIDGEPQVFRACWKIPGGGNTADNYTA